MTLVSPADGFYLLLHTAVIFFNLFGWYWQTTRRANLMLLLATAASWIGLGLFYGLGYCPLTEWHYQALVDAGVTDLPRSYIAYITERLSGWRPPAFATDVVTACAFGGALITSITLNLRDYKRKHPRQ